MKNKLFYILILSVAFSPVFLSVCHAYVIEDIKPEKIELSDISELSNKNFIGRILSPIEKIRISFAKNVKAKVITDPRKIETKKDIFSVKNKVTKYVSTKSSDIFNKPYAYYKNGFYYSLYYVVSKPLLFYFVILLILFFIFRALIRVIF